MHAYSPPQSKPQVRTQESRRPAAGLATIQRATPDSAGAAGIAAPRESIAEYARAHASGVNRTAEAPNRTGLPDALKTGIETLSGFAMDSVRVHRNSGMPARHAAHAYAQGTDIHLAPGQDRHLPHEAWHIVQQMQGRVRPTGTLAGGVPVNDDAGLEHEADRMGSRALAAPGPARDAAPLSVASGTAGDAPLQAVFVTDKKGKTRWEPDGYKLKKGERYYQRHVQRPSVLLDKGETAVTFDDEGEQEAEDFEEEIQTHKQIQKRKRENGSDFCKLLAKNPKKMKKLTEELSSVNDDLEGISFEWLPEDHQGSVEKVYDSGVTGPKFRGIYKGQDELTQSQSTANFFQGFIQETKNAPKKDRKALRKYGIQMLRMSSALRVPTQSIVAPVEVDDETTGQQHPTSKDQPKLDGGSSSHSYSDRWRAQSQVDTFDDLFKVKNASPNHIFMGTMLSPVVSTLSGMSAPALAENVPEFNPGRAWQQTSERESIKDLGNILGSNLGMPGHQTSQSSDAHWGSWDYPTSPRRDLSDSEDESDEESEDDT